MSLGTATPWERQVIDTFTRHLDRFRISIENASEVAQHGESPAVSEYLHPWAAAARDATPEEVAQLWVAVMPAVVETAREYVELANRPEKE